MTPIEDLVRQSLETRAYDVEPTPALWRRISSRIDRRTRGRRLLLALAGAAAVVLLVAVAVPAMLELFRPSPDLDIAPSPPQTTGPETSSGRLPAGVVTTDGQALDLRLLGSAGTTQLLSLAGEGGGTITDVAVRPASTVDDVTVAFVVAFEDGAVIRTVEVVDGEPTPVAERGVVDATDSPEPPSVVWSPEGRYLAWTSSARGDAPGVYLDYWGVDGPARDDLDRELTLDVPVEETPRLRDWVGDSADGGSSQLTLTAAGEAHAIELDHAEGEVVQEATARILDHTEVVGLADAHPDEATPAPLSVSGMYVGPFYALTADAADAGLELTWNIDDGDRSADLDLPEAMAASDHTQAWMDAWLDGVVVGDGDRAWLVTHDGDFGDIRIAELGGDVTDAAFLPGDEQPDIEPTPDGPATSPSSTAPTARQTNGGAQAAVSLDMPVVAADDRSLLLGTPDGRTTELGFMDPEGESTIVDVAVRPGSTADDVTVVHLTQGEGTFDLRWVVARDGEVVNEGVFADVGYELTGVDPSSPAIPAPVWSPDGSHVAWAETRADGSVVVRAVGWDQDGPEASAGAAADDAAFEIDAARTPLTAVSWDDNDDRGSVVWLAVPEDFNGSAYGLPAEVAPDGDLLWGDDAFEYGQVDGRSVQAVTGPREAPFAAVVGPGDRSLIIDPDGEATSWTLPEGIAATDGLSTMELDRLGADGRSSYLLTDAGESWWLTGPEETERLSMPELDWIGTIEVLEGG